MEQESKRPDRPNLEARQKAWRGEMPEFPPHSQAGRHKLNDPELDGLSRWQRRRELQRRANLRAKAKHREK
jgi:hypothetical protein